MVPALRVTYKSSLQKQSRRRKVRLMASYKEDIDRYFDYGILPGKRILYLGSLSPAGDGESGTDHRMCEDFIKGLTFLHHISKNKPITVYMNNPGGCWYSGMAMFDLMRECPCHITMIAIGQVFSMGSIILQAADTRIITKSCEMMIHDGTDGYSGHPKALREWAKSSERSLKRMYEIYFDRMKAKKPRITIDKIEAMCTTDKIFTAEQAVEHGLVDWIFEEEKNVYAMDQLKTFYATDDAAKYKPGDKHTGEKHEVEETEEE